MFALPCGVICRPVIVFCLQHPSTAVDVIGLYPLRVGTLFGARSALSFVAEPHVLTWT